MTNELSREIYVGLIEKYQAGDGTAFNEMVDYLETPINKMTHIQFNRVKGYGHTFGDVHSVALEVLWIAMETYEGGRGADFLAYYKQRLQWKVNDELIEKEETLGGKAVHNTISLSGGGNLDEREDAYGAEDKYLAEISETEPKDHSMLNVDFQLTYSSLLQLYLDTGRGEPKHIQEAKEKDVEVIRVVINAVEMNIVKKQEINEYLYSHYEGVNKNSVRRIKSNAFKRFGAFIKETL